MNKNKKSEKYLLNVNNHSYLYIVYEYRFFHECHEFVQFPFKKKSSRTFYLYIWYFKERICIKNRGFWEVLERIRALYENKDKHWIGWVFLHSRFFHRVNFRKNIQIVVFKKLYTKLCLWNNI